MKELIYAVVKTGGGSLLTMFFGAVTTKVIAVVGGTSGIGLWSIIKQIQQSALMIGTLNGNTPLVRGIGALSGEHKHQFMRTVMLIFFVVGLVVTATLIIFSAEISEWLKDVPKYVVRLMAIPILLTIARSYAQGCLNGYRAIGRLAKTQIAGAAIGALAAYPLVMCVKNGYAGGLVWLSALSASASLLTAIYYLKDIDGFYTNLKKNPFWELIAAKEFIVMAGALSMTGLVGVISSLMVKAIIVRNGGLVDVGLFESSWNLGAMYVTIILSSFGSYVLPSLSSFAHDEQVAFIRRVSKLTIIISIPMVVFVVCIKPLVITILYSLEFLPTLKMFRWMLIGDYLKISGWVFAMVLVTNRYIVALILSSVLWDLGLLLSVWLSYEYKMGLELVGFSIMVLHALSLIFYYPYLSKKIGLTLPNRLLITWFLGLMLVIFVSMLTWEMDVVNWAYLFMLLTASCGTAFLALESKDKLAISLVYRKVISKL